MTFIRTNILQNNTPIKKIYFYGRFKAVSVWVIIIGRLGFLFGACVGGEAAHTWCIYFRPKVTIGTYSTHAKNELIASGVSLKRWLHLATKRRCIPLCTAVIQSQARTPSTFIRKKNAYPFLGAAFYTFARVKRERPVRTNNGFEARLCFKKVCARYM